jgi:hypothetical protein
MAGGHRPQLIGDVAAPRGDLGPVPGVAVVDPQRRRDRPFGEGQALADQLASEHPVFAGLRRGDESRKSARVATAVRCVELPSVLM